MVIAATPVTPAALCVSGDSRLIQPSPRVPLSSALRLPDHSAEAGERSERKPGVERPRNADHEMAFEILSTSPFLASNQPATCSGLTGTGGYPRAVEGSYSARV